MIKRLSNLFLVTICFCMIFALIPVSNVNAVETQELIDKELKTAIISGDGSADNPYIVDYEKAPYFSEYMDNINEMVMTDLNNEGISMFGLYDNVLTGITYNNQTRGGYWVYKSGAPSTGSNGNIWMKAVTYQSVSDTKQMSNLLNNSYYWSKVEEMASNIAQKPYSDAYNLLVSSGIAGTAATSLLRGLGKVSAVFSAVTILTFINDYCVKSRYQSAANKGYGMVHCYYNTSYNGAWYAHEGEDVWAKGNDIRVPMSYYGSGSYSSY